MLFVLPLTIPLIERMDIPIGMVLSCLGDGALRLVKANVDDFIRVRDVMQYNHIEWTEFTVT